MHSRSRFAVSESRYRTRRRKRAIIRTSLIGGAIILLCAGTIALAHASFLRITSIDVQGTASGIPTSTIQVLAQSELKGSYLFVFPKNNILLYPKRVIAEHLLLQFPSLQDVQVHANSLSAISIVVDGRQPVALWCGADPTNPQPCLLLDESGIAYAPAPDFSAPVYPTFYGAASSTGASALPMQYLTPAQFHPLPALVQALSAKVPGETLSSVAVTPDGDADVRFSDGFTIMFALYQNPGDLFEDFDLALSSDVFKGHQPSDFEYLDLRFGDKLYYKLK